MRSRMAIAAAMLAAGFLVSAAHAADEALVLRQSAERLAAENRCEEAMERTARARALAPDDALAAAIEGRCAIHLKRYDAAVASLSAARELDPALPGVSADLAMAYFHRGDIDAADAALHEAEQRGEADHPKVLFYRGMIHLERAENIEAATALDRAARADASIDPLATYYASLAWREAQENEKARAALERLQQQAPGSPWAMAAAGTLDQLGSRVDVGVAEWFATITAGMEWDDNVVLRGDDTILPNAASPRNISDQQDWRGVWEVDVGAVMLRSANWSAGAMVGYVGDAYVELSPFNRYTPNASLWIDRRISEKGYVRLQPFFGYTWFSEKAFADPYLGTVGTMLSYNHAFDEGSGRLYGQFAYRDYLYRIVPFDQLGNDVERARNRDGTDYEVGYEHFYPVTSSTTVEGGVAIGRYNAIGQDWTHTRYSVGLGLQQELPWEFVGSFDGAYTHKPYDSVSTFFVSEPNTVVRQDNVWDIQLMLERPINQWLSVSARWRYRDNKSNTPVFDYDRHILGGYFTLNFGS